MIRDSVSVVQWHSPQGDKGSTTGGIYFFAPSIAGTCVSKEASLHLARALGVNNTLQRLDVSGVLC